MNMAISTLFITLIAIFEFIFGYNYGIKANSYSYLVQNSLSMDDLFWS
jgi:hypothetical protein